MGQFRVMMRHAESGFETFIEGVRIVSRFISTLFHHAIERGAPPKQTQPVVLENGLREAINTGVRDVYKAYRRIPSLQKLFPELKERDSGFHALQSRIPTLQLAHSIIAELLYEPTTASVLRRESLITNILPYAYLCLTLRWGNTGRGHLADLQG